MLMKHQTIKPERILKLLQIITSAKRWDSLVDFHGKNDQPRKNLDKLTILLFLEQHFMSFSMVNLVSLTVFTWKYKLYCFLFHIQFVLDLFFFFKQFQSHCVYKVFLIQKSKSSTNLNHKEGKQEKATID